MSEGSGKKIKVLVVDDSALMSRQIANILNGDSSIEVVGRAKDGLEALTLVKELSPDVVTMDVEMPRMNGITALKHIMVKYSTPTVMISALTKEGARTTFDALKYGAIDVIAKPSRREDENLEAQQTDIINKVKRAAAIRTGRSRYIRMSHAIRLEEKKTKGNPDPSTRFIGIGAGTGGYYALLRIIPTLTVDFHDILVAVVLVASRYIEPFVAYLDSQSAVPVYSFKGSTVPKKGGCYICSGEERPVLKINGDGIMKFNVSEHSPADGSRALDRMLASLASHAGSHATGIVLTGAGKDGAQGLSLIREAGGIAVIQDINNCVDPSMPLAALERGSVEKILPDYKIADFIMGTV
ncbi:MAG TPA: chemotaxis protein CheB [Desulfomonilaceae bacterium]|nr:chemotaxis protein CheB [Desulfomonilaceae bacterium]